MSDEIDDFYVVLPSNTKGNSQNTTSNFTIDLPNQLDLSKGGWQCALSELTYPHTFFNIENCFFHFYRCNSYNIVNENLQENIDNAEEIINGDNEGMINNEDFEMISDNEEGIINNEDFEMIDEPILLEKNKEIYEDNLFKKKISKLFRINIPAGHYSSGKELIEKINKIIKEKNIKAINFSYLQFNNKIRTSLKKNTHLKLSESLASVFGYLNTEFHKECICFDKIENEKSVEIPVDKIYETGSLGLDLNVRLHSLYIYTNIINYIVVGNILTPLLRIVPISLGNRGKNANRIFVDRYYHFLHSKYIKQIDISIRDDQGDIVKFHSGKVILVLHFKRKR